MDCHRRDAVLGMTLPPDSAQFHILAPVPVAGLSALHCACPLPWTRIPIRTDTLGYASSYVTPFHTIPATPSSPELTAQWWPCNPRPRLVFFKLQPTEKCVCGDPSVWHVWGVSRHSYLTIQRKPDILERSPPPERKKWGSNRSCRGIRTPDTC